MATNTYVALKKTTVTGSAASTITVDLTGITGYNDIEIIIDGTAANDSNGGLYFNGDTGAHYGWTRLSTSGSTATGAYAANTNSIQAFMTGTSTGGRGTAQIYINDFANTTTYKQVIARSGAGTTNVRHVSGIWTGTTGSSFNAITSFSIVSDNQPFAVGTVVTVFGITGEGTATTPKASGGNITSDSTYYYHTFTNSGIFTPLQSLSVDYLVVGGGGAGGVSYGAGGGAGGLLTGSAYSVTATAYPIVVGAGGSGTYGSDTGGYGRNDGNFGNDTTFATFTALKGGGGGGNTGTPHDTQPRTSGIVGSGGGGCGNASGAGGIGTSGQGNNGGAGNSVTSGGGGGKSSAGTSSPGGNLGGTAGNGLQVAMSGTSTYYAAGGAGVGTGGAGSAGTQGGTPANLAGAQGTGAGAGGDTAAHGGSGVVIIRYTKA